MPFIKVLFRITGTNVYVLKKTDKDNFNIYIAQLRNRQKKVYPKSYPLYLHTLTHNSILNRNFRKDLHRKSNMNNENSKKLFTILRCSGSSL